MPGQLGNTRDRRAPHDVWRTVPGDRRDSRPGDEIIVTTPYGRFVYLATTTEIVDADDWEVIATIDPTIATLTLTSCHPVGTASERIIVHAELDVTQSDAPTAAVFNYGRDAVANTSGELPGENAADPTTTAVSTTSTPASTTSTPRVDDQPPASTTSTSTSTTTPLPQTLPADTLYSVLPGGGTIGGGDDGDDGEAAEDAFSNHWFTDTARGRRSPLWGALATAVVVGGYFVAKRFRNSWIGLAAGGDPVRRRPVLLLPERQPAAAGCPVAGLSCASRRSPVSVAAVMRSEPPGFDGGSRVPGSRGQRA